MRKALISIFTGMMAATHAGAATPVLEKLLGYKEFVKGNLPAEVATRLKSSSLTIIPISGRDNLPACSGVIVSNTGYVITDFHCIYNKARSAQGEIADLSPKAEFRKAKVLAQGYGTFLNFPSSKSPGFDFKDFNRKFDDWALLKLPDRPGGYACAETTEGTSEGSSVYHMGFPQEYTMQNSWLKAMMEPSHHEFKDKSISQLRQKLAESIRAGLNKGEDWAMDVAYPLYVSLGYTYKTVAAAQKRVPIMSQHADLDNVIDLNNYNFSTAPIHIGMSGGGVFGIDTGHLIGLNVFTFGNMNYSYSGFPYGIGFIRVNYIKEAIKKKLSNKIVKEAFNCNPKSKNPVHFIAAE